MIPITPFSVKFPPEVRSEVKKASQDLGYSENHFILASVVSVLEMINQEGTVNLPKVVSLVKAARDHQNSPPPSGPIQVLRLWFWESPQKENKKQAEKVLIFPGNLFHGADKILQCSGAGVVALIQHKSDNFHDELFLRFAGSVCQRLQLQADFWGEVV